MPTSTRKRDTQSSSPTNRRTSSATLASPTPIPRATSSSSIPARMLPGLRAPVNPEPTPQTLPALLHYKLRSSSTSTSWTGLKILSSLLQVPARLPLAPLPRRQCRRPSSRSAMQTRNPVYSGSAAFTPVTGQATYQAVTLPASGQPLGDPPADIRAVAMPPTTNKPAKTGKGSSSKKQNDSTNS